MSKVQRGSGRSEAIIDANIDDVWNLLIDWENLDWLLNDVEAEGMQLGSLYLEGERDAVPRTRVMVRENVGDSGLPEVNRETLFIEDPLTYRLYYDADDGFIKGARNYIASWTLDPLPGDQCLMTISANFDVVEPGDVDVMRTTVEAVYDSIMRSLNEYFSK